MIAGVKKSLGGLGGAAKLQCLQAFFENVRAKIPHCFPRLSRQPALTQVEGDNPFLSDDLRQPPWITIDIDHEPARGFGFRILSDG